MGQQRDLIGAGQLARLLRDAVGGGEMGRHVLRPVVGGERLGERARRERGQIGGVLDHPAPDPQPDRSSPGRLPPGVLQHLQFEATS